MIATHFFDSPSDNALFKQYFLKGSRDSSPFLLVPSFSHSLRASIVRSQQKDSDKVFAHWNSEESMRA